MKGKGRYKVRGRRDIKGELRGVRDLGYMVIGKIRE